MDQPVSQECELKIVGRSAAAGGGIRPPAHPAGMAKLLQPVLHAAGTLEGVFLKRLADFQQLPHGQGTVIEGSQDFRVTRSETAIDGIGWHCEPRERTIALLNRLPFSVA